MATEIEEHPLEEQRSVVHFSWAKGLPAKDTRKQMLSIYSESCLSHQAVYCDIASKVGDVFRRKSPGLLTRGIFFYHHNARPHAARSTQEKI
ncbi:hypothetical protein AVEN_44829-1 [Araneus ventricosus]|uniref:Mos1 transposase HTH domain-containing protein n=1 Tax=Araneus ventricosus TaxID=182803 RepID=A0A4Y2CJY5_ARAVE|nr:hypothetical protein AVEN_44829-1 [Araneus ventricosus]